MTTSTTRRGFLIAAGAATATANSAEQTTMTHRYPTKLVHHVFFWLKNPSSKADRERLLTGLRTLAEIETIRGAHFGIPASTEKRDVVENSYSVSEILFFDDVAGQNVYQEHPIHKKFVADCSHLWEKVVVYDSIAI